MKLHFIFFYEGMCISSKFYFETLLSRDIFLYLNILVTLGDVFINQKGVGIVIGKLDFSKDDVTRSNPGKVIS